MRRIARDSQAILAEPDHVRPEQLLDGVHLRDDVLLVGEPRSHPPSRGLLQHEYDAKADVWPLAPEGEIIVAIVYEEVKPDEEGART